MGKNAKDYILVEKDVTAFYPNIILTLGLAPKHLGDDFLNVYRGIVNRRVAAKKAKNLTVDKGLKIAINGSFGKLGSKYSKLYAPDLMIQVTITGQLALLMLIEMLECNGVNVVSANTDGILIFCHKDKRNVLEYWVKYWEDLTGFVTEENEYQSYYARDVNAYFAVKKNAKSINDVKVKGPYSEKGSATGTNLDNNPITLICSDAIKHLLVFGTPVEETINACQDIIRFLVVRQVKGGASYCGEYLGKTVRWYYSKNNNNCIQYVLNGNKVADSQGATPAMDLPTIIPDELDRQFYVDKCISILYEIGYRKRPEQVKFF